MAAAVRPDLPLVRFRSLEALSHVAHGVSTRHGGVSEGTYGSLNLSLSVQDEPDRVHENRRRLAEAFGTAPEALLTTRQIHGTTVARVDGVLWALDDSPRADALMTDQPGALLMQRFADCVPIFLAASNRPAIGLAHAGWRGTVADVVGSTVRAMTAAYDVAPDFLVAGIGPSIGPCCFEVGEEVALEFQDTPTVVLRDRNRPHVNLWEANRLALLRAGLMPEAIEVAGACTRCNAVDYFSHRALGYPAGRFGGVIGLVS